MTQDELIANLLLRGFVADTFPQGIYSIISPKTGDFKFITVSFETFTLAKNKIRIAGSGSVAYHYNLEDVLKDVDARLEIYNGR